MTWENMWRGRSEIRGHRASTWETLERDFLNWIKNHALAHLEVNVSKPLRINQTPGSCHFHKADILGRKSWNEEWWLQAVPNSQLCVRLSLPFLPSVSGRKWNGRCMAMKSWLDADAKMLHDLAPFGVIFLFSINLVTPYFKACLKNKRQGKRVESLNAGQMIDLPISHVCFWPCQDFFLKHSLP